jgi:hypothetical protein
MAPVTSWDLCPNRDARYDWLMPMQRAVAPRAAPRAESLQRPLRRLLRPLVRLLIAHGVTFPVLADLLRGLYVEVAMGDDPTGPRARTDSRISLVTGIHRKEIRRLREMPQDTAAMPETLSRTSLIIARWLGTGLTTEPDGQPRRLPRTAEAGEPSFDSLVAAVTTDIRPRAVLDDFVAQGLVTIAPGGLIELNIAAFLPRPGDEQQLFYFGRNLADHIAAASANVGAAGAAPYFDRSVHYDGLTAAQSDALEHAARAQAQRLLLDINRMALAMLDGEIPAPDGLPLRRINLGVYLFTAPDTDDGP